MSREPLKRFYTAQFFFNWRPILLITVHHKTNVLLANGLEGFILRYLAFVLPFQSLLLF